MDAVALILLTVVWPSMSRCRQVGPRLLDTMQGVTKRVIAMSRSVECAGVAVSRDGTTVLVTDDKSNCIHEFKVADGSAGRVVGGKGAGKLQFDGTRQIWVAADGFVFVAEVFNERVQVLTPRLTFHAFIGVGELSTPSGVCANADIVVVSEVGAFRVSVFNRGDGALLRRFGCEGSGDGQLNSPTVLCFMSGDRHVAVCDWRNNRVSVFSVDGEFIRHVGVGVLNAPLGVACSGHDELVVADYDHRRVVIFGVGKKFKAMGTGEFCGVAIHRGTVVAADARNHKCALFM
jgi:DNA-binding beta-propeller fold protein YncE